MPQPAIHTQGEKQGRLNGLQLAFTQHGDQGADLCLRDRLEIVEIDRALGMQSVLLPQPHLRGGLADGRGDGATVTEFR